MMATSMFVNPPCRVIFAGWESDTARLGRAGWKISIENDLHGGYGEVRRMLLHFPACRLNIMATACRNFHTIDWRQRGELFESLPVFTAQHATSDFKIILQEGMSFGFKDWHDTKPAMIETNLMNTPLFLKAEAPIAEELIIEPQDVSALLDQIKRMQSPHQAEIRTRSRREQTPMAHATILSLVA